jgi:hypothetical protein
LTTLRPLRPVTIRTHAVEERGTIEALPRELVGARERDFEPCSSSDVADN